MSGGEKERETPPCVGVEMVVVVQCNSISALPQYQLTYELDSTFLYHGALLGSRSKP